jgi:hypothetical protein
MQQLCENRPSVLTAPLTGVCCILATHQHIPRKLQQRIGMKSICCHCRASKHVLLAGAAEVSYMHVLPLINMILGSCSCCQLTQAATRQRLVLQDLHDCVLTEREVVECQLLLAAAPTHTRKRRAQSDRFRDRKLTHSAGSAFEHC